jgi:hypothetical protein
LIRRQGLVRGVLTLLLCVGACKADSAATAEAAPAAAVPAPSPPTPPAAAPESGASAAPGGGAAPAVEEQAPPEPEKPAAPEEPYKVLLVGGSLAATGFGVLLEKRLDAHPHIKAYRKAKSASGLARPDFYDWVAEGKRQIELRDPHMVIIIMGGNDGQDLVMGKTRVRWDTTGWAAAYRERVDEFLHAVAAEDRKILWLGLPRTNTRKYEAKLEFMRAIHKSAVEGLGDHGIYVNTSTLLEDPDGNLMREVKAKGRKGAHPLRMDDGIHFTMVGSEFFCDAVYPAVLDGLQLEDVSE